MGDHADGDWRRSVRRDPERQPGEGQPRGREVEEEEGSGRVKNMGRREETFELVSSFLSA